MLTIAIAYAISPERMDRFSGSLLRYATILLVYTVVTTELVIYIAIRLFIMSVESAIAKPKHRKLWKAQRRAKTYQEWYKISAELDHSQCRDRWQKDLNDSTAKQYSWSLLQQFIDDMQISRENGDIPLALSSLQQCIHKNFGGIMRAELYSCTNTGESKLIVHKFVEEVVKTLKWCTERADSLVAEDSVVEHLEAIQSFIERARVNYGRTALCLSGGAMMGCYHLGAVRALLEEGMLPHIISGASAGGLTAAMVCTRTDEELRRDLLPEVMESKFFVCARPWSRRISSFLENGSLFDSKVYLDFTRW